MTGFDVVAIATAADLRSYLDDMNDAGVDPRVVGLGATGNPFLIHLEGAYAERETVIVGSPWDSDCEYRTGTRCDDCNAANLMTMADLQFPVTILRMALLPVAAKGLQG